MRDAIEARIVERLAALRIAAGLSLEDLAERSGVSRATLSRMERGETSPTAGQLGRLCAVHGWTLSRLMAAAEDSAPALIRRAEQPEWTDPRSGFTRRAASPPGPGLRVEITACELPAGAAIDYPAPPLPGMEQHILMQAGTLDFTHDAESWRLSAGDCLRVKLHGATRLAAGARGARYLIIIGQP